MLVKAVGRYERVYPLYVRNGLQWERVELFYLRRFLRSLRSDRLEKLTVLELSVASIYGRHWSLGHRATPSLQAADQSVYLPGRNALLLSLAGTFCAIRQIHQLWVGVLKGNPFRDASVSFFRQAEKLLREAMAVSVRIQAPLAGWTKSQVIRRSSQVAWARTFSCLKPVGMRHCGRCQKCGERQRGFKAAGVGDPTRYA